MIPFKQTFQKMNLDADCRYLKEGEYRRLINGITVSPLGQKGLDGVISNIVANLVVANADLQATSKVVGFLEDTANNRCFYAVYHSGGNHTIYTFNFDSGIKIVLRSSVFDFLGDDFVSMDILGDELVITNNRGEIRQINVTKAIAGTYASPAQETISLIKKAPTLPLILDQVAGFTLPVRYSYSGYQFYYRWIYEDGQASVWGSMSKIYSTPTPNINQILGIRITVPSETVPDTVTRKEFAFRLAKTNEFVIYRTELLGAYSADHFFFQDTVGETVPDTDSFKWFEAIPEASKSVKWMKNRLFLFNNKIGNNRPETSDYSFVFSTLATIPNPAYPGSSPDLYLDPDDYYVFKSASKFKIGILFTDWAGRHIGCLSDLTMEIAIPDFNFTDWSGYRIGWDLTGKPMTNIPIWATDWQWVRTKSITKSFFLQGLSPDAFYYKKDDTGAYVFSKTVIPDSEGVAIDLSNMTKNNIGYNLNQGDFVRLYTDTSTFIFDKKIEFQDGKFIFIKGSSNIVTLSATAPDIFYYEIYTPYSGPVTETFYEIGEKYGITDPGTGSRAFGTLSGVLRGDCYMKRRTAAGYNPSGYSATDPYANVFNTFSTIVNHQAMNPSDDFFTDWIQDTGRAVQDTPSLKEIRLTTNLRFSRPYINVATTPQFNIFDALDDQQLPLENGAGTGLAEAGEVLVAVHEGGATSVYVGQGFVSTSNDNSFLTKTDQVIGDFRKYLEKAGCINPATIIAKNGRVYWLDIKNGYVIRRSQDGITPISVYGMRTEFSGLSKSYREDINAADQRIVAGWDPKYRCYTISFQNFDDLTGYISGTYYWHEDSNGWVAITKLFPEFFGQLTDKQLHFSAGDLFRQRNNSEFNHWFGVNYIRELQMEIAPQQSLEKIWTEIDIDVEDIYIPSVPATQLSVIAPTSWTDESTPSAPTFGSNTISKTNFLTGLIKAYQALAIQPGGSTNVLYRATISNLRRNVNLVSDPTPGDWSASGAGTAWSAVGSSIQVVLPSVGSSNIRYFPVSIPAGTYSVRILGSVSKTGSTNGSLAIRFYSGGVGGSQVGVIIISGATSSVVDLTATGVLASDVDTIRIDADMTLDILGSITYKVDSVQVSQTSNVTEAVTIAEVSTVLADGTGVAIDSKSSELIHPGPGSKEFVITHTLTNVSGSNSARLYAEVDNLTTDIDFDVVLTFPVGYKLYDTIPSAEDVVLMYSKLDDTTILTRLKFPNFKLRASSWRASFKRYEGDLNYGSIDESRERSSQKVRGQSTFLRILNNDATFNSMKSVTVFYEQSMISYM